LFINLKSAKIESTIGAIMIDYKFIPISLEDVLEIENWTYDGYMKNIYMKPYHMNLELHKELKGPDFCDGFSVYLDKNLFGLFEYYQRKDYVEIGMAINPKYAGKGFSKDFIEAGILFLKENLNYHYDFVYLSVEKGNEQAYHAYLKSGFKVFNKKEEKILMRRKI